MITWAQISFVLILLSGLIGAEAAITKSSPAWYVMAITPVVGLFIGAVFGFVSGKLCSLLLKREPRDWLLPIAIMAYLFIPFPFIGLAVVVSAIAAQTISQL